MQDTDYFVRMDCCDWYEADFFVQLVNSIKGAELSKAVANEAFGKLRPMRFESLFRQAQRKDVEAGVDQQATFILLSEGLWNKLPHWSWPLLCGVLKHAMSA